MGSARSGLQKLWSGTEPEEAEMIMSRKVVNAIKEEELQQTKTLPFSARKEIAQVVQCDLETVNKVLLHFKTNSKLQEYIKSRKDRGEYLPRNKEELMQLMHMDRPPKSKDHMFMKKPKHSRTDTKKMSFDRRG